MKLPLLVTHLGRRPYAPVLELQRALCKARGEGRLTEDLLLLVEHDPVMTLGRSTKATSLPLPVSEIEARGIEVHEIERGGDVTYHGPGQLVGYPIVDLQQLKPDLHWYLRELETILILAMRDFGVEGRRSEGQTGVWVGPRKIASIGVHVKKWVTLHGFALNVSTDLDPFGLIVPCGIDGVEMTSMLREMGPRGEGIDVPAFGAAVSQTVAATLAERFDREPTDAGLDQVLGNLPELAEVLGA